MNIISFTAVHALYPEKERNVQHVVVGVSQAYDKENDTPFTYAWSKADTIDYSLYECGIPKSIVRGAGRYNTDYIMPLPPANSKHLVAELIKLGSTRLNLAIKVYVNGFHTDTVFPEYKADELVVGQLVTINTY